MNIAIIAATKKEWEQTSSEEFQQSLKNNKLTFSFHETGVGILATSVSLMSLIAESNPDIIVQVGVGGCFDDSVSLGKTVCIQNEFLGDSGVYENHDWNDIFDLQLANANDAPFKDKSLPNPHLQKLNLLNLDAVTAVTVNEVTTGTEQINILKQKYNPVVESMEGAALHYVCLKKNIPFLQIRAISNFVGERNKENWMLPQSIKSLNETLIDYVDALYSVYK